MPLKRSRATGHSGKVTGDVKMTALLVLFLALLASLPPSPVSAADDPLGDVTRSYGLAEYEETLLTLNRLDYQKFGATVDEYRALCFLALNRDVEAERAMESLIRRHPQPLDDLGQRPPKFAGLYSSVRKRLIPSIATAAYQRGKTSLERRDYEQAVEAFAEASTLASGEGLEHLRDLRMLADEFRSLSEQQIQRAQTPVLPEAVLAMALPLPVLPPPPPPREFPPIPRVYGPDDDDVKAPIVIDQTLPAWNPPTPMARDRTFRGTLKLVVAEDGTVASAEITQGAFLWYGEQLLKVARQWRYRPAMKGNHAVRYRRIIDFNLRPNGTRE